MIKLLIATPTSGNVKARYAGSIFRMITYFYGTPIKGREQEEKVAHYQLIESSVIHQAREDCVKDALAGGYTHLLFIDDDMGFREDLLNKFIEHDLPIVSCNYRMKVAPCPFTARSLDTKYWVETTNESTGLEQVFMTGFGFCLIKREVLEKMTSPMFLPYYTEANGKYSTEDTPFFLQLKRIGYKMFIDHDASKRIYHIGTWAFGHDDNYFRAEQRLPTAERVING